MTRISSSAARRAGANWVVLDPLGDQVELDRLGVHLLHPGGGLLGGQFAYFVEQRRWVFIASPEALEIEDPKAAETPDLDGCGRADDAIHGRGHQGQPELVRIDLPRDVDILGVAGPPAGDDGNVVEPVGPPARFEDADL
jgi:hypothetical protein